MKNLSYEEFENEVKKELKSYYYFRTKTLKEIDAICKSEDGVDFIEDGYEMYQGYEEDTPEASNNLSAAVNATVYNMYMWF